MAIAATPHLTGPAGKKLILRLDCQDDLDVGETIASIAEPSEANGKSGITFAAGRSKPNDVAYLNSRRSNRSVEAGKGVLVAIEAAAAGNYEILIEGETSATEPDSREFAFIAEFTAK